MAGSLFFALTPVEPVVLDAIRDERPVVLAAVIEELSQTCQGWVVTGLGRGPPRPSAGCVRRPGDGRDGAVGEDEDLRETRR